MNDQEARIRGFATVSSWHDLPVDAATIEAGVWLAACLPAEFRVYPTADGGIQFESDQFEIELAPVESPWPPADAEDDEPQVGRNQGFFLGSATVIPPDAPVKELES